jgi:hypothetical protein
MSQEPENYRHSPEAVIHLDAVVVEAESDDTGNPLDSPEAQARLDKLTDWYVQARDAQSVNRMEQALDHDYYDGLQWSDEDRRVLMERGQPALVFNKVAPAINWVSGTEKKTRIDYQVVPRGSEDTEPAEAKTKLLKYLSDVNRIGFNRSRAFLDAIISGVGWMEHCIVADPDDEPLRVRYEDWRNIYYDHLSVEPDLSDARYLFRQKWTDEDLAVLMFPGREEQVRAAATYLANNADTDDDEFYWQRQDVVLQDGRPASAHMSSVTEYCNAQNRRRRVKLIECWYREPCQCQVIKGRALGPENGTLFDPQDPYQQFHLANGLATVVDALRLQVRCAFFAGHSLLWEGPSPYQHNRFPFVPIWCYRRKRDNAPYGVVRGLRDVQDDLNKRRSKAVHLLSVNQMIYEQGAIPDVDAARDELNAADGMVEVAANRLKSIIVRDQPQLAEEHVTLMEQDGQFIQEVSGITDENLGLDTNATSGRAIQARQQQGHVVTATIFDNLRFSVQLDGEIDLSNIEQFYDTPKTIRILGDDANDMQFLDVNQRRADGLITNPITASVADFVVDEEDYNQSTRQAMFQSLMDLIAQLSAGMPQIAAQLLPIALTMSDLPNREAVIARVNQALGLDEDGNPIPQQEPPADPEAEARTALTQAQTQKTQADAELSHQKAITEQTEQQVRAHGMQFDQNAQDMQRVKLVADVASQHQANQQSAIQHQHSAQMDRDKLAANIANEHDRNQIAASKTAGEPRPGHTMPGLQSDNTNPGVGNPV